MIIPTFQEGQYVNKEGRLTDQFRAYNDEFNNVLRNGLSDNGWTLPVVTTEEFDKIDALPAEQQMPNGTILVIQDTPDLPAPQYNEIVVKLDNSTGTGTSAWYKLTKTAYP